MRNATVAMPAVFVALLSLAVLGPPRAAAEGPDAGGWRPLFNGKDLSGWKVKIKGYELGENFGDTFRVEDGLLKVRYDAYDEFRGRFGHIFCESEFSSYRLRVEYRFVGGQVKGGPGWAFRNSGIMIHGQSAESMRKDQNFPVSIEVQLLGGGPKGERPTANLCTPGTNVVMDGKLHTRHCTSSTSDTYRGDRWVTVEVEVRGNRVRHIVEGETVIAYTDPQLDERDADARRLLAAGHPKRLRRGTISLQSESHPVEFRRIEIRELDDGEEGGDGRDGGDGGDGRAAGDRESSSAGAPASGSPDPSPARERAARPPEPRPSPGAAQPSRAPDSGAAESR